MEGIVDNSCKINFTKKEKSTTLNIACTGREKYFSLFFHATRIERQKKSKATNCINATSKPKEFQKIPGDVHKKEFLLNGNT